jgi:hypothetical protein
MRCDHFWHFTHSSSPVSSKLPIEISSKQRIKSPSKHRIRPSTIATLHWHDNVHQSRSTPTDTAISQSTSPPVVTNRSWHRPSRSYHTATRCDRMSSSNFWRDLKSLLLCTRLALMSALWLMKCRVRWSSRQIKNRWGRLRANLSSRFIETRTVLNRLKLNSYLSIKK